MKTNESSIINQSNSVFQKQNKNKKQESKDSSEKSHNPPYPDRIPSHTTGFLKIYIMQFAPSKAKESIIFLY